MASFYLEAAGVLDAVAEHNSSLKAIVANSSGKVGDQAHKRRLLALCANTLAYATALDEVIERTELLLPSKHTPDWAKGGAAPLTAPPSALQRKRKRPTVVSASGAAAAGKADRRPSAASLARVLLHDLLISPTGKIQAGTSYPPLVSLNAQRARLHAALVRIQLARGAQTMDELRSDLGERQAMTRVPRWVRLVPSRVFAVPGANLRDPQIQWEEWLAAQGLRQVGCPPEGVWLSSLGKEFALSSHVSNVYALHQSFTPTLLASEWYHHGAIVLQDLASCFPAQLLASYYFGALKESSSPAETLTPVSSSIQRALEDTSATPAGNVYALDATAAPGNKTSHLSSLLHDAAPTWAMGALERDHKRYKILMGQLRRVGALASHNSPHGAKNTTATQGDFLALDPGHEDWSQVRLLLLDPSCSGSGILGRWNQLTTNPSDEAEDLPEGKDRLAQLSSLQVKMIEQAMKFPALEAFTYSTCSIHREENEEVVARVLQLPLAIKHGWRLVPIEEQGPLALWPHRGVPQGHENVDTTAVLRAYPGGNVSADSPEIVAGACHTHATNGFFVALFARSPSPALSKKRKASPMPEEHPKCPTSTHELLKLSKGQKKKLKKRRQAASSSA